MKVFDLHNDLLTVNDNFIKELNSYPTGVEVAVAIYKGDMDFSSLKNLVQKYKSKNCKNTQLAFEDIGYKDLDLDYIISLNPLYVSLTHNLENSLGYGVNNNLPLKNLGVEVVKKLEKNGAILDIAHLSKKGAIDVLNNSSNVICSHTCFSGVYKNKRNLDDDIIKEIVNRNGVIGLTFVSFFLSDKKTVTIYDVIKHIDYFVSKFSIDNLSVGTDFNGTNSLPLNLNDYKSFDYLKSELIKRGYLNSDVNKIFYLNAKNYFSKTAKILQKSN